MSGRDQVWSSASGDGDNRPTPVVQPALTAEEWTRRAVYREGRTIEDDRDGIYVGQESTDHRDDLVFLPRDILPALIAMSFATLPDDDPRKITHEWVEAIRVRADAAVADHVGAATWTWVRELRRIADALESYLPLPPET